MQLSESIYEGGLVEEVTRITGATIAVYSNKARVARFNDGLDKYWFLAAESAPQGTFDDSSRSSAPIETQNIVSGTNSYKVSSFTNEVLSILRVSVLDSSGIEFDLEYQPFENIIDFQETYSTDSEDQGLPSFWTKIGDYIYLAPCPNYSYTAGLRCYVNRELSKFNWTTFTVTIASPGVFTATGHGLVANDALIFETDGALPTGLTADTTLYYVISTGLTADDFRVSTTIGGSAVNTSVSQSGNHKFTKATKEPGIPVIHHKYLAYYAADQFMDAKHPMFQKNRADLMKMEKDIPTYWQSMIREGKTIISTATRNYK